MPNSTQVDEIIRLTAKIADHEKRIASLEASLSTLASRIAISDHGESNQSDLSKYLYFGEDNSNPVISTPVRRGRRPRISPENFARRRDEMVVFIEIRWPWLVDAFNQRKSIESIFHALAESSPGGQDTWQYRKLIDHLDQLWDFLHSGRYTGEPRQIAYASAGLPELRWRSSLDWGNKNPSPLPIHPPAFVDHIRRHNPLCLEVLEREGVTPQVLKLLKTCCVECKRLAKKSDWAQTITEAAERNK